MKEDTNKAIAYNTIILYGKMVINTICALLTTRFALKALGVVDYGLFAVLGGIISFMSIFNTIMLSTSNRFIAVSIGKGNQEEINKQFNVNFSIHLVIALVALLLAIPVGNWYIPRFVNYDGALSNALIVYYISIFGCVVSFIGVPYNGLLMAKERFIVFSLADVASHLVRLLVAWSLVSHFNNKLIIYAITISAMSAMPTLVYIIYCTIHFKDIVRLRRVKDRRMYKEVFAFSSWVGVGAIAQVGKDQGAALVVNAFFDTVMNTAMGIASSINAYVILFAQSISQPIAPQITKSYAANNLERTDELLIMSTKYAFLLTLLLGSFFLAAPEWLLGLWLGEVPPFAPTFLVLMVIDAIIRSLNSGVASIIFADGTIRLFQILTSVLNLVSVLIAYLVLKIGAPAYSIMVVYIFISICMFITIQFSLRFTLKYDIRKLWRSSYLPSLLCIILYLPFFLIPGSIHPLLRLTISTVYLVGIEWFICFKKEERDKIKAFIISKFFSFRKS